MNNSSNASLGISSTQFTPAPGIATWIRLWCPPSQSKFYCVLTTPVALPNAPPRLTASVKAYTSNSDVSGTIGDFGVLGDATGVVRVPIATVAGSAVRALDACALAWISLGGTAWDFDIRAAIVSTWGMWVDAGGKALQGGGGGQLLFVMGGATLA